MLDVCSLNMMYLLVCRQLDHKLIILCVTVHRHSLCLYFKPLPVAVTHRFCFTELMYCVAPAQVFPQFLRNYLLTTLKDVQKQKIATFQEDGLGSLKNIWHFVSDLEYLGSLRLMLIVITCGSMLTRYLQMTAIYDSLSVCF